MTRRAVREYLKDEVRHEREKAKRQKFAAPHLVALLAAKHAEDVFVPECKTGDGTSPRLDAFAMAKSWAHPLAIGYEVKVDRQDFLRDTKWRGYLPCCNQFFFVCPPGIIEASELPDDVGLYHVASTGNRLMRKKNAKYRDLDMAALGQVLRYILFWRIPAIGYEGRYRQTGREHWERHFAEMLAGKEFGRMVGKRLGDKYRTDVLDVRSENLVLKARIEKAERVEAVMKALGVRVGSYDPSYEVRNQIERLQQLVPQDFISSLHAARRAIEQALEKVEMPKRAPIDEEEG